MNKADVLSYKGYFAKIIYDREIKKLTGIIEGIGDLIYFESESVDLIEKEFHLAVEDYLDFCKEKGIEPDKVYKGTFNVRIDPKLHKKLSQHAFETHQSLNSTVEKAIELFVDCFSQESQEALHHGYELFYSTVGRDMDMFKSSTSQIAEATNEPCDRTRKDDYAEYDGL